METNPSPAVQHILALVSGYPSKYWPLKTLVFLQAFVDDSASDTGDRRLFLAGYIANAETWAAFSNDWQETLEASPRIQFLHMVEAQNLRDQFAGWSAPARDAKLMALAQIIRKYRLLHVWASVSRTEYTRLVGNIAPYPLKSPYFGCFMAVMSTLARYLEMHKRNDVPPVDFIFDDHSAVSGWAGLWFNWIREDMKHEWKKYLGATPVFKDDKALVALQAADMLAWTLRREHERGGTEELPLLSVILHQGVGTEFDIKMLSDLAEKFSRVPNLDRIQTKRQWQKLMPDVARIAEAGMHPDDFPNWRVTLMSLMQMLTPIVKKIRRRIKRYL
jgi:hypothetical protein